MDIMTKRLGAIAFAAALVVAACGGGSGATTNAPSQPLASQSPAESEPAGSLSGEIVISGSSTVGPISTGVKELFNAQNPDVAISVDEPGTGDGFALFCEGQTDISDASRAIKEEEATICADNGVEYVELKIGIDGLSVITSIDNDQVPEDCLTFNDIYALIGPESTGFDNWSDAQPLATELGATTQLPDAPLTITAPGEESGTYDSFVELVIVPVGEVRVEAGAITEEEIEATRPDYQSTGDDNIIIDGVAGSAENPTTLGWVGFAYVENALDRIKPLKVDNGESGCVEPTPETIAAGEYPIARDLFIYVNKARADENPAVTAFVDFYLAEGTLDEVYQLPTARYIPLTEETFAETVSAWESR